MLTITVKVGKIWFSNYIANRLKEVTCELSWPLCEGTREASTADWPLASGSRNAMPDQRDHESFPFTKHRLKVGLFLPSGEGMSGDQTAKWADLVAMVQRAEAVGFDSVWLPD